jgi:hypothetical protein
MSQAIIFLGPTLSHAQAHAEFAAEYLPPAAYGDLYRAALRKPAMIGLVDGLFERVPAVWHKEILWAVHEGIHVYGSASMGALRAAELAAFGMAGVGQIFEAYHTGAIEDDDEVAVVHADAEHDFRPLSVALVNIRATLARAEAEHVISGSLRTTLLVLAKQRFYPQRDYQTLIADARAAGVPMAELAQLQAWLPDHQVDQKRADARTMVQAMRIHAESGVRPKQVQFHFEHTNAWERVVREEARRMSREQ